MPDNVPGSIHGDTSAPCPEHALTPTPPPPSPSPALPVYALVAPDTRCDMSLSQLTSYEWSNPRQSFLSCCSDVNTWSGAASGQTFAQLRANCEAACSSGVHGQCNVITYYSAGESCNLAYYDGLVRVTLVDSVVNNECQAAPDMSTWVLATTDAYTLVGADTKCEIHTRETWASYNGDEFHECCAAHDGDAVATQSFEQLKANCEAACDGWAAVSGRGSCNVITYEDELRCELGYYDAGTDAFAQRIANGDCSSDAHYDTYVRNTPLLTRRVLGQEGEICDTGKCAQPLK